MKFFINDIEFSQSGSSLTNLQLSPSVDEKSPSLIEFDFILPLNSTFKYQFYFEKMFLKISEHPPDAK